MNLRRFVAMMVQHREAAQRLGERPLRSFGFRDRNGGAVAVHGFGHTAIPLERPGVPNQDVRPLRGRQRLRCHQETAYFEK